MKITLSMFLEKHLFEYYPAIVQDTPAFCGLAMAA